MRLGPPSRPTPPSEARGLPVDRRTDIWAFGCLLYELLTGRQAFAGPTASDSLAAVLEREPDMTLVPVQTSRGVRSLLRHCLEKDPKRRLRDIADARLAIDDPGSPSSHTCVRSARSAVLGREGRQAEHASGVEGHSPVQMRPRVRFRELQRSVQTTTAGRSATIEGS
jgi:serine/threonine protein kinase